MQAVSRNIGNFRSNIPDHAMGAEYLALARTDEDAARLLHAQGLYRQSVYLVIQAMEKYVKAKIFSIVSARHACYRQNAETHDLDKLITFFAEILTPDANARIHFSQQLGGVLGNISFSKLHNDLRYPYYSNRHQAHRVLEIQKPDADSAIAMLDGLRSFLDDSDRLKL